MSAEIPSFALLFLGGIPVYICISCYTINWNFLSAWPFSYTSRWEYKYASKFKMIFIGVYCYYNINTHWFGIFNISDEILAVVHSNFEHNLKWIFDSHTTLGVQTIRRMHRSLLKSEEKIWKKPWNQEVK